MHEHDTNVHQVKGYAIAGDVAEVPVIARQSARSVESAPDAATMLDRHAGHVVAINTRSAGLAQVVESSAGTSPLVADLWEQMTANRRFAARWAATTLLTKPGTRPGLTHQQAERDFVIAIDWGTHQTLTAELGLTPGQVYPIRYVSDRIHYRSDRCCGTT